MRLGDQVLPLLALCMVGSGWARSAVPAALIADMGIAPRLTVYGTDMLAEPMRYISKVGFDLTSYLKSETLGEAVLNVTLGTHTFLKVKVENLRPHDGDSELPSPAGRKD